MATVAVKHRKVTSGTVNPAVEVDLAAWNDGHDITGLEHVDNTSDMDKPVSSAQEIAIAAVQSDVDAHEARTDNPHAVTQSQVGLGNVDNTSDANKPVSTAQATALALKANLASPTFTGAPAGPTATVGTNTTQFATTAFANAAVPNAFPAWTAFTPTCGAATGTVVGAGRYFKLGKVVFFQATVTLTSACTGAITMTLPVPAASASGFVIGAKEIASTGLAGAGYSTSPMLILRYDGATFSTNGMAIYLNGTYEAA